jgi:hypothetical protein
LAEAIIVFVGVQLYLYKCRPLLPFLSALFSSLGLPAFSPAVFRPAGADNDGIVVCHNV